MKLITNCKYPLRYDYYVTEDGHVWSGKTNKFLSEHDDKNGYKKVRMSCLDLEPGKTHTFSVHRLVLENFNPVEGMEELQVNHKDGNKANNSLDNLEWMTCIENIHHAIENGLRAVVNGAAKLTPKQVEEIYKRANAGERNVDLSNEFSVHPDIIGKIKNGKTWREVTSNLK
jgi:hypothetical protein